MTVHHLPQPPSDDELYWYFGPQRRWVLVSSSLAFVFTAATMFTFALRTPALWAFLAVLGLNVVALLLSSANSLRQRRLTRASHDVLVRAWRPAALPTVDLYLPTCGEPLPVLANAYRAVAALDWPDALTVWVLDDADRAEVAALAAEHGYRYVVRPDRGHLKKAGNLNHALPSPTPSSSRSWTRTSRPGRTSCAIWSPTSRTRPSASCRARSASTPTRAWTGSSAPPGPRRSGSSAGSSPPWDAADAAICCGSNAVYRRSAIDLAGGFARLDHSEDLYTGLALHERGFRTQYVPVLVAKGTSPDTVTSYVNQQYRWAMGNLHLLGTPVLKRMGAPWRMRLCFYEGVVGYLTTAVNTFAAPLPPLVMMFGYPDDVRPWHVLPLLAPLWLWHVLMPRISRTRWRVEVIRAGVLTSVAAATAFWHTLRAAAPPGRPRGCGAAGVRARWPAGSWASPAGLARPVQRGRHRGPRADRRPQRLGSRLGARPLPPGPAAHQRAPDQGPHLGTAPVQVPVRVAVPVQVPVRVAVPAGPPYGPAAPPLARGPRRFRRPPAHRPARLGVGRP